MTDLSNGQSGFIQSPMTQDLGETNPALVDWFRDAAPVGRLGVPQDLSPTVCHLFSDAGKLRSALYHLKPLHNTYYCFVGSFISGSDILITGKLHHLEFRPSFAYKLPGGIHAGRLDHLRKK